MRLVRTGITATANIRNPRTNVGGRVDGNSVHLSSLKIINGCLLFDTRSGKFHRISDSAIFVIEELRKETPVNKLANLYADRYQIQPEIAIRDIELFMNDIKVRDDERTNHRS